MNYPRFKRKRDGLVLEQRVPFDDPDFNVHGVFPFWVVYIPDNVHPGLLVEGEYYPSTLDQQYIEEYYEPAN